MQDFQGHILAVSYVIVVLDIDQASSAKYSENKTKECNDLLKSNIWHSISNNKIKIKSGMIKEFCWEWFSWDADIDNLHMVWRWVTAVQCTLFCLSWDQKIMFSKYCSKMWDLSFTVLHSWYFAYAKSFLLWGPCEFWFWYLCIVHYTYVTLLLYILKGHHVSFVTIKS